MRDFCFSNREIIDRTSIKGNGDPILLLHGMGGYEPLTRLMDELSSKFMVIRPVMPGFLEEDGIINYHDSLYVDFLEKLRENLKIDKWTVIGYSMGGRTALNYSIANQEHTEKLVIIDGVGADYLFPLSKTKIGRVILSNSIYYSMKLSGFRNNTVTTEFFDPKSTWSVQLQEVLSSMMKSKIIRRNFANIFAEISSPIPELKQRLESFKSDTLILWAEQDKTVPLNQGLLLKKIIPNSEIKQLENYGHLAIMEESSFFSRNILEFLR